MLDIERIKRLVQEKIEGTGMVLIDTSVSSSNKITILVDSVEGVKIDVCIGISRHVEGNLNREEEDFELEVSSPGLGQPFKTFFQYQKNVGREIEVVLKNGLKQKGLLEKAEDDIIWITEHKKVKEEGKKRKQLRKFEYQFDIEEIKSAFVVVSFK